MSTGALGWSVERTLPQEVAPLATALAKAGIGGESFRIIYHASGAHGVDALVSYLAERRIIEPERASALRMVLQGYVMAPVPLMLGNIDVGAAEEVVRQARTSEPEPTLHAPAGFLYPGGENAASTGRPHHLEEEIATELDEIRFFVRVGLLEDAREVLRGLKARFPGHSGLKRALHELRSTRHGPALFFEETAALSDRMREATKPAHRSIEQTPFVQSMLRGIVRRDPYTEYLRWLYGIYGRLERSFSLRARLARAPWRSLVRQDTLAHDLKVLGHAPPFESPSRASAAYFRHLDRLEREAPWGLIGHAYCRYLGDLSGGRIVGRLLAERHGFTSDALTFYAFDEDPKVLGRAFRRSLDEAVLSPEESGRVVTEAQAAFAYQERVFRELGP